MKKKNQIKPNNPNLISDVHVAEMVMTGLAQAENERRQFIARLDDAILKLQADATPALKQLDTEILTRTDALRAWALASPEAFGKKKSIAFAAGTVGFRTGTPALEPLNRKWTWPAITAAVAQALPRCIRTRTEVDRAALLAQRTDPAIAAALPALGLRVVQTEAFYVESNLAAQA
jgi:phage host-nuclease inhibitor protein Gam